MRVPKEWERVLYEGDRPKLRTKLDYGIERSREVAQRIWDSVKGEIEREATKIVSDLVDLDYVDAILEKKLSSFLSERLIPYSGRMDYDDIKERLDFYFKDFIKRFSKKISEEE